MAGGCGGPKGPLCVPVEGQVTFAGQPVTAGPAQTILLTERLGYTPENTDPKSSGFRECPPILSGGKFWSWNFYGNIHGPFSYMSVAPNVYSASAKFGTPYSFHPGGLQVTYADGSVRWIAETIGFNVWTALAKKADGFTLKY